MPTIVHLKVSPKDAANDNRIKYLIAATLHIHPNTINAFQIIRRSIDARSRNIVVQLQLKVFVGELFEDHFLFEPRLQNVAGKQSILIAGAGPAGLYAALRCIEEGYCPIIVERGKDVRSRRRDLAKMNKEGIVNSESNYCFGEGGAGTYSDGKLYTRSNKRGNIQKCLQWFRYFGASENVLIEAHPHIGTNKLPGIIAAMRDAILACGGQVLFRSTIRNELWLGCLF
jgi:uncharacterized FAD-dependent dehydrogenase